MIIIKSYINTYYFNKAKKLIFTYHMNIVKANSQSISAEKEISNVIQFIIIIRFLKVLISPFLQLTSIEMIFTYQIIFIDKYFIPYNSIIYWFFFLF